MIRVSIFNPEDRRNWCAYWKDPVTGRTRYKSTGTTKKTDAQRFAAALEHELNAGESRDALRTTWKEFRERYETEVGPTKAPRTLAKTRTMFDAFEELVGARFLSIIDGRLVSTFAAKLRARGIRPYTVRGYLAELRKTLRWAHRLGMLATVPAFEMPRVIPRPKGRGITLEEFERLISKIPEVVTNPAWIPEWERFCWGLWFSSLRICELMDVHWTDRNEITPEMGARRPYLIIPAHKQKNRQTQLLPIPPDFFAHLNAVAAKDRRGWVYNPWTQPRGGGDHAHRPTPQHVGKVLSKIGKLAGIRVSEMKFASAHDLRRSFANRWARTLNTYELKEMMRHSSIETTLQFYMEQNAEAAADRLWSPDVHISIHSQPAPSHSETPAETADP